MQYQKVTGENEPVEGSWKNITTGGIITDIANRTKIYARLIEGTSASENKVIEIKDEIAPKANIELDSQEVKSYSVLAKVIQTDEESGINIKKCKWVCNTNSNSNIDETEFTQQFKSETEELNLKFIKDGTYYLHVLCEDNAGNKIQTISKEINVEITEYVQDGLVVLYDANNNTGNGYSNSTKTWKNLVSDNYDGVLHGCTWGDNYLQTDGVDDWLGIGLMHFQNVTVETVLAHGSTTEAYGVNNFDAGGIRIIWV